MDNQCIREHPNKKCLNQNDQINLTRVTDRKVRSFLFGSKVLFQHVRILNCVHTEKLIFKRPWKWKGSLVNFLTAKDVLDSHTSPSEKKLHLWLKMVVFEQNRGCQWVNPLSAKQWKMGTFHTICMYMNWPTETLITNQCVHYFLLLNKYPWSGLHYYAVFFFIVGLTVWQIENFLPVHVDECKLPMIGIQQRPIINWHSHN